MDFDFNLFLNMMPRFIAGLWLMLTACCVLLSVSVVLLSSLIQILFALLKQSPGGKLCMNEFLSRTSSDNKPSVIAHRGGQFEAPENTLKAINTAHLNGADAVEIDLAFSNDSVPVLFHDETVNRTTNSSGYIHKLSYEEIQKLDAAYLFKSEGYSFEKVPTLEEAVKLCLQLKMKIFLDVKGDPAKTVKALKDISSRYPNVADIMLVTSFQNKLLYQMKKELPQFSTGLIFRHHYSSHTMTGIPYYDSWWYHYPALITDFVREIAFYTFLPKFLGVSTVIMNKNEISRYTIQRFKNDNISVVAWTVNNPLEKKYLQEFQNLPVITDSILDSSECQEQSN